MIDDAVCAAGQACFHLMIHEMGREFGGRAAAFGKTPADPVLRSFGIQLGQADIDFGIIGDIAHEFSGTGHEEKVSSEFGNGGSDIDPRTGLFLGEPFFCGLRLFGEEVIGCVSAVAFVKTEPIADFAHSDKILDKLKGKHG